MFLLYGIASSEDNIYWIGVYATGVGFRASTQPTKLPIGNIWGKKSFSKLISIFFNTRKSGIWTRSNRIVKTPVILSSCSSTYCGSQAKVKQSLILPAKFRQIFPKKTLDKSPPLTYTYMYNGNPCLPANPIFLGQISARNKEDRGWQLKTYTNKTILLG